MFCKLPSKLCLLTSSLFLITTLSAEMLPIEEPEAVDQFVENAVDTAANLINDIHQESNATNCNELIEHLSTTLHTLEVTAHSNNSATAASKRGRDNLDLFLAEHLFQDPLLSSLIHNIPQKCLTKQQKRAYQYFYNSYQSMKPLSQSDILLHAGRGSVGTTVEADSQGNITVDAYAKYKGETENGQTYSGTLEAGSTRDSEGNTNASVKAGAEWSF